MNTKRLIQEAINALKDSLALYAFIADILALFTLIILAISKYIPLWPHVAIALVVLLVVAFITLFFVLGRVIVTGEKTIAELEGERRDLTAQLLSKEDRKEILTLRLENKLRELTTKCNDLDSFLRLMEIELPPLLFASKELSIRNIGIIELVTSDGIVSSRRLFESSKISKKKEPKEQLVDEFDAAVSKRIIASNNTTMVNRVIYNDVPIFYIPIQDQIDNCKWYIVFLHTNKIDNENVSTQIEYFIQVLSSAIKNSLSLIYDRMELLQLRDKTRSQHLFALLYNRNQKITIEQSIEYSKDEINLLRMVLSDPENNRFFSEAFNAKRPDREQPIAVARNTYAFSLTPMLIQNNVYEVILFIYSLTNKARLLSPESVFGEKQLSQLIRFFYKRESDDTELLVNKSYFERHLEHAIVNATHGELLGLFVIGLQNDSSHIFNKLENKVFQNIAKVLAEWVVGDMDQRAMAARYEAGLFLLIKKVQSNDYASAQALGLKNQIDTGVHQENDKSAAIGVLVYCCKDTIQYSHQIIPNKFILEAIECFYSAEKNELGIYVKEYQVGDN